MRMLGKILSTPAKATYWKIPSLLELALHKIYATPIKDLNLKMLLTLLSNVSVVLQRPTSEVKQLRNPFFRKISRALVEMLPKLSKEEKGFLNKIKVLNCGNLDVGNIDFSLFPNVVEVDLYNARNLTSAQIQQLSHVQKIYLYGRDVRGVDFSKFKNVVEIALSCAKNLTPAQIQQLSHVKILHLNGQDVNGVDFSKFKNLVKIYLASTKNLTKDQIEQLSHVQIINLTGQDVNGVDFSKFQKLVEICLTRAKNLTKDQIEQLSGVRIVY